MTIKDDSINKPKMAKDEDSSPFQLPVENTGFSSRSKDVFASLDSIEKTHEEKQKVLEENPEARRDTINLWKEEPVVDKFKRPFNPPPPSARHANTANRQFRKPHHRSPDYKIHPKHWTKYSLEDCETSESSNCKAAFAFLEERRKLREAEDRKNDADDESVDSGEKFVFKKPSKVSGAGVNSFSSRKSASKRAKLDEVSIGHVDTDSGVDSVDKASSSKESSPGPNDPDSEPRASSGSQDGAMCAFKKGNRKRSIRVREISDETD